MFNVCKISLGLFWMCLNGIYGSLTLVELQTFSQTTRHMTTGMLYSFSTMHNT